MNLLPQTLNPSTRPALSWPRGCRRALFLILLLTPHPGEAFSTPTNASPVFQLASQASVDSSGIYLDQVIQSKPALSNAALPHLRFADAPPFNQAIVLTRAQIQTALKEARPAWPAGAWTGPDRIRIVRRLRPLLESEIRARLTQSLQQTAVRDKGELELSFYRPWTTIQIPDEPFEVKIVDLPSSGIASRLLVRFELRSNQEVIGSFQSVCQAKILREILVAATPLKRGRQLDPGDLTRERRDLLTLRDALVELPPDDQVLELTENVETGAVLLPRSLRPHPVVRRGDLVVATVEDGPLSISIKVEVLEDGASGQTIRIRNPISKREFRGKVQNEQRILVVL